MAFDKMVSQLGLPNSVKHDTRHTPRERSPSSVCFVGTVSNPTSSSEEGSGSGRLGLLPGESKAKGVSCESSTSVRSTNNLPSAAASPTSFQTAASTSALDQCGPRLRTSSFTERMSPEGQ